MTGELLTVKEYAARQGMTEQAAYKQIRAGKLVTVERQENGKAKKYIFFQEIQTTKPEGAAGALDPGRAQLPALDLSRIRSGPRSRRSACSTSRAPKRPAAAGRKPQAGPELPPVSLPGSVAGRAQDQRQRPR